MADDGNCLLPSLSVLLEGDESQNTPLRKGAAENLSMNYDQSSLNL